MLRRLLGLSLAAALLATPVLAQSAPPTLARGTVSTLDGNTLTLATPMGGTTKLMLSDATVYTGLSKVTLEDIKPDTYVGVVSLQADGVERAVSIHIFPAAQRGAGEGSRPWDQPGATMTNGAVSEQVTAKNGEMLTIKYGADVKKVMVTPETSIVRFEPGAALADVKPGVRIVAFTNALPDGTVQARRLLVVRGDFVPAL